MLDMAYKIAGVANLIHALNQICVTAMLITPISIFPRRRGKRFKISHSSCKFSGSPYSSPIGSSRQLNLIIAPRRQDRKDTSSNRREQRKRSFLIHLCYLRYLL